jgi:predicted ATPase/class 3 adenylate cyclase
VGRRPTGRLTFCFTDIEGSTLLLEHVGDDAYADILNAHHRIIRAAISLHHGVEVSTEGDAFFAVFESASDGVAMTLRAQRELAAWASAAAIDLRVRMGLHVGQARLGVDDDYVGLAVHHAARVSNTGHGGQVIASREVVDEAASVPPEVTWRSMGHHRLKDLGAPIELFQLCHPSLVDEHPPLRTLDRVEHNLPVQASSFVGRTEELAEGARLLHGTRLLTLVGPGGVGKTRIAYQLTADQIARWPDGVWVAELASTVDPHLVPAAIRTALGLREEPGRTAVETIVAVLRTKRALVVLDNCEHVVGPAADLTARLLQGCGELQVIATSREPLRLRGERVWTIGPLASSVGEGQKPLDVESVALFCARAGDVFSGFDPDTADLAMVQRICEHVQGIPLAIELAAARVRTLSLSDLEARLERRDLQLLSRGPRGGAARQASMRAAIAWSHELLASSEAVLFRRLAIFAKGFDLDALMSVCGTDPLSSNSVVDLLEDLVDKSLAVFSPDPEGSARYRLLETIRSFAHEQLEMSGEAGAVAARHAAHYRVLAESRSRGGVTPSMLDALEADHQNILDAIDQMSAVGDVRSHAALLGSMTSFWDVRGHWRLASREYQRLLDRSDLDADIEELAAGSLGRMSMNLGNYGAAQSHFERALALARARDDPGAQGRWLGGLGIVTASAGEQQQARRWFEEAVALARSTGNRRSEANLAGNLASVALLEGDIPAARAGLEDALAIARQLGDRRLEQNCVGNLGNVAEAAGDLSEAQRQHEEARRLAIELGDRRGEAISTGNLGLIEHQRGELDRADVLFGVALSIAVSIGDRLTEAVARGNLAALAVDRGHVPEAAYQLDRALSISDDVGGADLDLLDGAAAALAAAGHCVEAMDLVALIDRRRADTKSRRSALVTERYKAAVDRCASSPECADSARLAGAVGRLASLDTPGVGRVQALLLTLSRTHPGDKGTALQERSTRGHPPA